MKRLILILVIFNSLISFGQNNYAEINFMPYTKIEKGFFEASSYRHYYEDLVFKLYINDNLITSMKTDEVLRYKIYSKGRIAFTLIFPSEQVNGIIEINENKTYYVVIVNKYKAGSKIVYENQEIPKEISDKLIAETWFPYKRTIKLEEDIYNPIGVIPKETISTNPKSGTGFLISQKGLIVTNHHVIDKANKIVIKGINGDFTTLYTAKLIFDDEKNDLAILKLENESINFEPIPYAIRKKVADSGEDVFVLGYPMIESMGEEIKLTTGVISSKTGYQGDVTSYQVSAPVQGGNSGGPLFDKNGLLTGVINAKIQGAEGVTYAIKSNYLNALIEQLSDFQITNQINILSSLTLQEQVKLLSKFVYIIEVNN
jgi:V8-like Glu-specific endopeptidase